MAKDKRLDIRFSKSKVEQIRVAAGDKEISEYIREAVDMRLQGEAKLESDRTNISNRVEELNTKLIEQKIAELMTKQQIIFKEINKQNEAIKLIHRRVTLASSFAVFTINELKKNNSFNMEEKAKLVEIIDEEISEIGL